MRFLLVSGLTIAIASGALADTQVGQPAPEFKLQGTDGKTYRLSQFKGKQPVVIAWFPKAKTGGCTKECKSLRDNSKGLRELNVAFFTASCDTPSYNKEFAEELKLDYPILSDPDGTVAKAYGVYNEQRKVPKRWTFYIDKDGVLRDIDKSVNVASHGEDVASKLKELGLASR